MNVILEIKAGPFAGRKITLGDGESILIGRAVERAQFGVPHDNLMSGVHFAAECDADGCRVTDMKSTNGTFLNGGRIRETMPLANGDEIKSGQTVFVVRMVPDAKPFAPSSSASAVRPDTVADPNRASASTSKAGGETPASAPARAAGAAKPLAVPPGQPGPAPVLAIGSWVFHRIPKNWKIQEGLGIQQEVKDAFPAGIGVMEEQLGCGITFGRYVEEQTKMFRENLREPKIGAVAAPTFPGSDETAALEIRHKIKDGPAVFHHRVYVRKGSAIGVLMLTTLEKDLAEVRPVYDLALTGITFSSKA
ncbi:MAG: FHA domain-containing protein [Candidatus Acidiferrum sp.]